MKETQIVGRYPQLADLNNFSLQKYEKENDIQCEGNPTISFAILQSLVRRRVGSISWCNGNMAFPTFMTQFISFIVILITILIVLVLLVVIITLVLDIPVVILHVQNTGEHILTFTLLQA